LLVVRTPDERLTWLKALASRRMGDVTGGIPGGRRIAHPRHGAVQDVAVLVDGDGTITEVSQELENMFGYGHDELPGRPRARRRCTGATG
jgi:PAS domain-containing protein